MCFVMFLAGELKDMSSIGVWDPFNVKVQCIKTALESAILLLRIDDVVSGVRSKERAAEAKTNSASRMEQIQEE